MTRKRSPPLLPPAAVRLRATVLKWSVQQSSPNSMMRLGRWLRRHSSRISRDIFNIFDFLPLTLLRRTRRSLVLATIFKKKSLKIQSSESVAKFRAKIHTEIGSAVVVHNVLVGISFLAGLAITCCQTKTKQREWKSEGWRCWPCSVHNTTPRCWTNRQTKAIPIAKLPEPRQQQRSVGCCPLVCWWYANETGSSPTHRDLLHLHLDSQRAKREQTYTHTQKG